jgi:non-specific serine/threonine protein kinase
MRSGKKIETNLRFLDGWFLLNKKKLVLLDDDLPGAELLNGIVQNEIRMVHSRLRISGGEWKIADVPMRAIGYALAVVRRAMQVETLWLEDRVQLRAEEAEVTKHMPLLAKLLNDAGIPLVVDEQEVRTIPLELSVEAEAGDSIDWFELHPTVRMLGRTLTGEEWLEIIRQDGIIWTDDGLAVIDAGDMDLLSMIQDLVEESDPLEEGIVQVPRLEIFKWVELMRRGVAVEFPENVQHMLEALQHFESLPPTALPRKLQAELRPYQKQGYDWLAFLYLHRFGACLADDMGLGKTVQTIALLGGVKEGIVKQRFPKHRPHLIVVPSSLVFNWCQEITQFYPELSVYEYLGTGRSEDFSKADVVITTYGTLARSTKKLKNKAFDIAVFDEAQAIKNIKAERTGAARLISAEFKLCLTGTPVENHIGEYYSIMDLAVPGLLGGYGDFSRRDDALEMAVNRTRPFILRRTKAAILSELPPKVENEIHLDLSPLQKECYTRTVAEVKESVEDAFSGSTGAQASIVALTALLRLRQVCISPAIHDPAITEVSPKLEFIADRLMQLEEEGHAALVFSQFTRCLDLIEEQLKEQGIRYVRLDGKTPTKKRKDLVERFQSEDGPAVFLISLKSGGVGLNLTRASYVFHVDPWWNPAAENQASDRAHRMGQQQTVFVTRLVMRHTVEEKIMQLKEQKQAIFDAIISGTGDGKATGTLTREDFEFLLT